MANNFRQQIKWADTTTINNYNARVLFSVVNKELRRGVLLNALAVSKELFDSGELYQEKLWQRLITVAAEDVGLGNVGLYTNTCLTYQRFQDSRDFELIAQIVYKICSSPKSRFADELLNFVILKFIEPNKSYFSYHDTGEVLNNASRDLLIKAINEKELVQACNMFISLALSDVTHEEIAWDALIQVINIWHIQLCLARDISKKMKFGKNDRLIAGILYISAYIMDIHLNDVADSFIPTSIVALPSINIPDYALDLHANVTNRKLTVSDFRQFWIEGSILNNEVDLTKNTFFSPIYKQYILDNLDRFLDFYYFRKSVSLYN